MKRPHVLYVRLDNDGDVLLQGPAIRAVAHHAERVTLLAGPRGRRAAALLPHVDEILVHEAPWIDPDPQPVTQDHELALVQTVRERDIDAAIIATSFHQSALPTALLLRFAGVPFIAAISEDYPGSLLDVRHKDPGDIHEAERALGLALAAGFPLPRDDDGRLQIKRPGNRHEALPEHYVVVHPGASVPARAWMPERNRELVQRLADSGTHVAVTGAPSERELTAYVAGDPHPNITDLGGTTNLAELADVIADAQTIVVGNTGPAHLAAAVGTPVVSLYAPTVPPERWRPYKVEHRLLYAAVPCAGCRAKTCPVPNQPCLSTVDVSEVEDAVKDLAQAVIA